MSDDGLCAGYCSSHSRGAPDRDWHGRDVLDGGVNDALNLDMHGKSLSFHLLTLPVTVPTEPA